MQRRHLNELTRVEIMAGPVEAQSSQTTTTQKQLEPSDLTFAVTVLTSISGKKDRAAILEQQP